MTKTKIPKEILDLCAKVTKKRSRIVIDHIIKHGYITTEELKNVYGYDHPPRAIRDVREEGIPLVTYKVVSTTTGRKIGAYRFDSPDNIKNGRIGGRIAFSKSFKKSVIEKYDSRNTITMEKLEPRYLQIDHRIPYEIAGNSAVSTDINEFMLLDASSQRAKSWSCEHCENFLETQDINICKKCFWAYPEEYEHVAMRPERRLEISWVDEEVKQFLELKKIAQEQGLSLQDYFKKRMTSTSEQ